MAPLVLERVEEIGDPSGERQGAAGLVQPFETGGEQQPLARLIERDWSGGADGFERSDDLLVGVEVTPQPVEQTLPRVPGDGNGRGLAAAGNRDSVEAPLHPGRLVHSTLSGSRPSIGVCFAVYWRGSQARERLHDRNPPPRRGGDAEVDAGAHPRPPFAQRSGAGTRVSRVTTVIRDQEV